MAPSAAWPVPDVMLAANPLGVGSRRYDGAGLGAGVVMRPRPLELRRCRYAGLAKTHLQHAVTAAINLVRTAEWCAGTPVAQTRVSRFAALQAA